MVINRPSNNAQNSGVDSETTRDVLNRLDRTIRILEGELAKPNPFGTRSQLIGQLREAKALKVSLETAVQTGALTMNQPLFNNRGMPTAEPGSFIESVLKRAEAAFGLFSNQFSINNGGFGPFKPDFKFNNRNRGDPFAFNERGGEFAFNNGFSPFGPNFKPSNGMPRGEMPAYLYKSREELAQNQGRGEGGGEGRGEGEGEGGGGFAEPRGAVGSAYPGLNGYIFGKDGTTPVQVVAARPVPHMWPHTDTGYYIYNDSLQPAKVTPGMKVPGTVKTYYGAAPLELGGEASMTYPDGTYRGLLEQPPTPQTITASQAASGTFYIPDPGDRVVSPSGGFEAGLVHGDSASAAPLEFEVAGNIPWIGSGSTHVFKTDGTPLEKAAGVIVPGQSSQVYSEALSPISVSPGVFVPGSGVHSAGGNARTKMYTSTNPSQQLTWQAGADVPWVDNVKARFNASGQVRSFNVANAYPGQANTVFDTDYSAYTIAAGKEVPGSAGYDRTDPETADADGIGPAARVYNAALQPVPKTRGQAVPGAAPGTVFSSSGGGAEITTVSPGQAFLTSDGVSDTSVYSEVFTELVKQSGVVVPGSRGAQVYQTLEPGNPRTAVARNLASQSSIIEMPDPRIPPHELPPGEPHPTIQVVQHQLALYPTPRMRPVEIRGERYIPYAFDPTLGLQIQEGEAQPLETAIERGEAPPVLLLPGRSHAEVVEFGARGINTFEQAFVARDITDAIEGGALPYAEGISEIMPRTEATRPYQRAETITTTSNASGDGGSAMTVVLQGSRSLMYNQGFGASTSTTSSSRSSGGFRSFMNDPRANGRWF